MTIKTQKITLKGWSLSFTFVLLSSTDFFKTIFIKLYFNCTNKDCEEINWSYKN